MSAGVEQLVQAVHAASSLTVSHEDRKKAIEIVEAAKNGQPAVCLQAFQRLLESGDASSQLNGLTLARHVIKRSWNTLPENQRQQLIQYVHSWLMSRQGQGSEAPVKAQLASIAADVAVYAGSDIASYTVDILVGNLMQSSASGAYLASKIVQYMSEELGEGTASKRDLSGRGVSEQQRRLVLPTMTRAGPMLLSLAIQAASHYLRASEGAAARGDAADAAAARGAVNAALDALASLAMWLPMRSLREAPLMDACHALLTSDVHRSGALEVVHQIACRNTKTAARDAGDYATLMSSCAALLAVAARLAVPQGEGAIALAEDEAAGALAMRVAEAFAALVLNGHLAKMSSREQLPVLEHLALLLGSGYLPIAAVVLPCWRRLVQLYDRWIHNKPGAAEGGAGVVGLPEGALRLVMRVCTQLLVTVISPGDDEDTLPAFVDSISEWKELCGACKSSIKVVLAEAAACAPVPALEHVEAVVSEAAAACRPPSGAYQQAAAAPLQAAGSDAELVSKLEVMAFLLDAMLAAIVQHIDEVPAGGEKLVACANAALAMRPTSPLALARCGRALECLAPVVVAHPALASDITGTFFALVDAMHAARGGVPVGNSDTAPFVREQRQLTKCYCGFATHAPAPLAPLLDATVEQTHRRTAAGILGDADRNTIYEGLAAVAARRGAPLFGRVFAVLLAPLREFWETRVGGFSGVAALVADALHPVTHASNGVTRVGGAETRVAAFYTLQLLTFVSREAKNIPGGGGNTVLVEHAEWVLLPALRLHRLLLALAEACTAQPALEPLRPLLSLSPLERAVCMGQSAFLDAKARVDELDPGRLDHTTISGARGWLRQSKELVLMLFTETLSTAPALWCSARLRQATVDSFAHSLQAQEPRALRLLIHHGVLPITRSCPPDQAPLWLPPLLQPLLGVLGAQLGSMWADLGARVRGEVGGAQAQQTEDEIVAEVLLRELSRSAVELVRTMVGSSSYPSASLEQLALVEGPGPSSGRAGAWRGSTTEAVGGPQRRRVMEALKGGEGPGGDAYEAGASAGPGQASNTPWPKTAAAAILPGHQHIVEAAVRFAVAALLWPDLQTQHRAVAACRTVAAAAGAPANPAAGPAASALPPAPALQSLLLPVIMDGAMRALATAGEASFASELLLLVRSIYLAHATPRRDVASKFRELVPGLPDPLLAHLDKELEVSKTEKHQKEVFRSFFVALGLSNLDNVTETRAGAVQLSNTALEVNTIVRPGPVDHEIVWPSLYDVDIR